MRRFERAMDLRASSQVLAKTLASQDYEKGKAGLLSLATTLINS